MQAQGFPKCCTSTIVTGMGSSENSAARSGDYMSMWDMLVYLHRLMNDETRMGHAMIQAVITDQQKNALKVMRALGWRFGPWAKSRNHRDTKTRLCYWLVQDSVPPFDTVRNKLGLTT